DQLRGRRLVDTGVQIGSLKDETPVLRGPRRQVGGLDEPVENAVRRGGGRDEAGRGRAGLRRVDQRKRDPGGGQQRRTVPSGRADGDAGAPPPGSVRPGGGHTVPVGGEADRPPPGYDLRTRFARTPNQSPRGGTAVHVSLAGIVRDERAVRRPD